MKIVTHVYSELRPEAVNMLRSRITMKEDK